MRGSLFLPQITEFFHINSKQSPPTRTARDQSTKETMAPSSSKTTGATKKPAGKAPAKTASKKAPGGGEGGGRHKKKRVETYSTYIYKVLKQVLLPHKKINLRCIQTRGSQTRQCRS